MTGTLTMAGGEVTSTVAKLDYQVQIPVGPASFSSGTWTATDSSNVIFVTRTPANTTEYYSLPIIVPSRTTALKGAKLKSVTAVVTLGGNLDTTNDDFEINIIKVTTPVDGSAPVGSVLAGDSGDDYPTAQNTKAKRLTSATHTFVVSIPDDEQAFAASGEQYYARIKIKDDANADLTCVLKGMVAQFDMNVL
jgi:hypothetical protein